MPTDTLRRPVTPADIAAIRAEIERAGRVLADAHDHRDDPPPIGEISAACLGLARALSLLEEIEGFPPPDDEPSGHSLADDLAAAINPYPSLDGSASNEGHVAAATDWDRCPRCRRELLGDEEPGALCPSCRRRVAEAMTGHVNVSEACS